MITLIEILDQWKADAKFDATTLGEAASTVSKLHSKYLRYLCEHKAAVQKYDRAINTMYKIKHEYYSGRLSSEELEKYGWEPFQLRLKSDIPMYINADEDITKIKEKLEYHHTVVASTESILKQITYRNHEIKNLIDWEKFISGN